ncbi:hypothetical protein [Vibrio diazotrophicus]|uniref:hypothetical protein n=1 Tax=Vibrio diazotrophicus TaxID=685 RepID=UPI003D2F880E
MSKVDKLLSEAEQEVSKGKAPSWARLMLMLFKVSMKEIRKELRDLREFVNSPDSDDLNRHV